MIQRAYRTGTLALRVPGQARSPFQTTAEVERAQRRRLTRTVLHGYETVPYYGETMRRFGLGPADFATTEDLARLPIIKREDVQRDPEHFVSRAQPIERYLCVHSGGSTGAPRKIFHDAGSVVESGAYAERRRQLLDAAAERVHRDRAGIPLGLVRWSRGLVLDPRR